MRVDPLADVVTLLQPSARFSKQVECAGAWRIHPQGMGEPFYCAVLEGCCRITVDGQSSLTLQAGDVMLIPAMRDLVNESLDPPAARSVTPATALGDGHYRVGRADGPVDLRMQIGHCSFGSPDAALLVSLLPQMVIARGEPRLATLVQLVCDETRKQRPARALVLERLLEVLLIEALRCGAGTASPTGLARGLADDRLAAALCALHARPGHPWTIGELAAQAALSRSAFFARFKRTMGLPPMEYILAWRMALAKRLLQEGKLGMDEVAQHVGYGSASAFSVAFVRGAGMPPARFAQMLKRREGSRRQQVIEQG